MWLADILNLFFPGECHLCGNSLSSNERFVCNPCIETLPRTGYHRINNNPMVEKFAGQFPFVSATGHFFYSRDSSLSQLIQDMKYRNFPSIGEKLGEIAGKELVITGFLNDIDLIVPLPMHYLKKARRGYNQTDRIAKGLSNSSGIPIVEGLRMIRGRKTQTSLSHQLRLSNADNLFAPQKGISLDHKNVLLVDDICTTGATMGAAAKALTDAFPSMKLYLFALATAF